MPVSTPFRGGFGALPSIPGGAAAIPATSAGSQRRGSVMQNVLPSVFGKGVQAGGQAIRQAQNQQQQEAALMAMKLKQVEQAADQAVGTIAKIVSAAPQRTPPLETVVRGLSDQVNMMAKAASQLDPQLGDNIRAKLQYTVQTSKTQAERATEAALGRDQGQAAVGQPMETSFPGQMGGGFTRPEGLVQPVHDRAVQPGKPGAPFIPKHEHNPNAPGGLIWESKKPESLEGVLRSDFERGTAPAVAAPAPPPAAAPAAAAAPTAPEAAVPTAKPTPSAPPAQEDEFSPVTEQFKAVRQKKLSMDVGTNEADWVAESRKFPDYLTDNTIAEDLLDSGMFTGTFADTKLALARLYPEATAWLSGASEEQVKQWVLNTETFQANRAMGMMRLLKQMGAGSGLSDADREVATQAAGGRIDTSEGGLRNILRIERQMIRDRIRYHNEMFPEYLIKSDPPEAAIKLLQENKTDKKVLRDFYLQYGHNPNEYLGGQ